jgi:Mg-chelatase subunit ChlD
MFRNLTLSLTTVAVLASTVPAAPRVRAKPRPKVEVVFCLDTTGSMGGLIDGAKQKIWAICNQIASGRPTPDLKVGLVAYRDRGDEYITKVFDLTDDLDAVHGNLKKFVAAGGGDWPESVNQALFDAVHKVKWSKDNRTLRIIFLVGDAPPHMDYKDDVKYPVTCQEAVKRNIIINTVQCGRAADTEKVWRDIAAKAEGSYVAIEQSGGVRVVSTPFDKRLGELNARLSRTTLVFGSWARQAEGRGKEEAARKLPAHAAACRIAYQAKNAQVCAFDLLDNVKQGKVKLEELKREELPPELCKLSLKEQKAYLARVDRERTALNREVLELDRKRSTYIAKKQAEEAKKGRAGFDAQVLEVLRNQAKKAAIAY